MALTQTQVSELYVSIFNRASEGEGNTFWQAYSDPAACATAMLETDAAQDYFGSSLDTDQAFIEHIYLNTLNKTLEDDPDGIAFWVDALEAGSTRGEVVASLVAAVNDYAESEDPATLAAYNQFVNRVEVSNYMADNVEEPPEGWETSTQFGPEGLDVTDDAASVEAGKSDVDDFVPPTYTMTASAVSVYEGVDITYTITSDKPVLVDTVVQFNVVPGIDSADETENQGTNLTNLNDFEESSFNPFSVTILAGTNTASYTVSAENDTITEWTETYEVQAVIDGEVVATKTTTLLDGDAPVFTLTAADDADSVAEGESITYTLTATAPVQVDTVVNFFVVPGDGDDLVEATDAGADDFAASALVPVSVTILKGTTTATYTVTPADDGISEIAETYTVQAKIGDDVVAEIATVISLGDNVLVAEELDGDAVGLAINTDYGPLVGAEGGTVIDALAFGDGTGTEVLRVTGNADIRVDLTNPLNQVKGLDLNGIGGIATNAIENNLSGAGILTVQNFAVFDFYARNPLNTTDAVQNYLGDIEFDGTGWEGDGVSTDGNIFLGGLGDDTAYGGIGNDFLVGGTGDDFLSGGRNADFFFVSYQGLDEGDSPDIDGGSTSDDAAVGNNTPQDSDWVLLEVSDDYDGFAVGLEDDWLQEVENLDASGNLYGFVDDIDVALGENGMVVNGENVGIGATAQLDVSGSDANNTIIGGFDNDVINGMAGDDLLFGGRMDYNNNPNTQNIVNDGADVLIGGIGDDHLVFEMDGWNRINGGGGIFEGDRFIQDDAAINDDQDDNDEVVAGEDTLWLTDLTYGTKSLSDLTTDDRVRLDLGVGFEGGLDNYSGYGGADANAKFGFTADQTNYKQGINPETDPVAVARTTVNDMEHVIATGLNTAVLFGAVDSRDNAVALTDLIQADGTLRADAGGYLLTENGLYVKMNDAGGLPHFVTLRDVTKGVDYLAAGTNDPELNFNNQQNIGAIEGDLDLRGTSGDNILYAAAGDDILEGRWGDDLLSGGNGSDDFIFFLNSGDDIDVIHRQTDDNGDNLWDGSFERDFGIDGAAVAFDSTFTLGLPETLAPYVDGIRFELGGTEYEVTGLTAADIATWIDNLENALAATEGLEALTVSSPSVGVVVLTDPNGGIFVELQDGWLLTGGSLPSDGLDAWYQNVGAPIDSDPADRLIFASYEDRADGELVDDDGTVNHTGDAVTLGGDGYAEDLVARFDADGNGTTILAEDQAWSLTFENLADEDTVTVSVNGTAFTLQMGVAADGTAITETMDQFLARLEDLINAGSDNDTLAGSIAAAYDAGTDTLTLTQLNYNGGQVVFMDRPVVTLGNASGGESARVVITNNADTDITLFQFDGRGGALNAENVLFLGGAGMNNGVVTNPDNSRSVFATATDAGGVLNGSDALILDSMTDADTVATDFVLHGHDSIFTGIGDDIVATGTGDDTIYGSVGTDFVDGGKDIYVVQTLVDGQIVETAEVMNAYEAGVRAAEAGVLSVDFIDEDEVGGDADGYADTLVFSTNDFSGTRFTVTVDDDLMQMEGGAGTVGVDEGDDGDIDHTTTFVEMEAIRTLAGNGTHAGQGHDTLDVSALSDAVALTAAGDALDTFALVWYNMTSDLGYIGIQADLDDDDVVDDVNSQFLAVDGVERLIGGNANDILYIDESEVNKDNYFDGDDEIIEEDVDEWGDVIVYDHLDMDNDTNDDDDGVIDDGAGALDFDDAIAVSMRPSIEIVVESDTEEDLVKMTGGTIVGSDTTIDTLVDVETIDIEDAAISAILDDVLNVSNINGAFVDFTDGQVRDGADVMVRIVGMTELENTLGGSGDDTVEIANDMTNYRAYDSADATTALSYDSFLNYDLVAATSGDRRELSEIPVDDRPEANNQGLFSFDLAGGTDRVDYSLETGNIAAVVNLDADETTQTVFVMNGDFALTDATDRIDLLSNIEEIVASQNASILDFTGAGQDIEITFQYDNNNAIASLDRMESIIRIADGDGDTIQGISNYVEYYDMDDDDDIAAFADATWNRVEGSDFAETIIYQGSEDLVNDAGLDHRFTNDTLNLRGGANNVAYSALETSITAVVTIVESDENTTVVDPGVNDDDVDYTTGSIHAAITFQDGNSVALVGGGTHNIYSYTSDNDVAEGTLKLEASQDAEDTVTFVSGSDKLFILGTSAGVLDVQIGDLDAMRLTGFEILQDAATDDVYLFETMTTGLTLVDNGAADTDTIKVNNNAIGFDGLLAPQNDDLDLAEFNALGIDFDIMDVTAVTTGSVDLVGAGGAEDETVILDDLSLFDSIEDFDVVQFAAGTPITGTFTWDMTGNTIGDTVNTIDDDDEALTLDFSLLTAAVAVAVEGLGAGTETVIGTDLADVFDATEATSGVIMLGGAGNDTITGGAGADQITGGEGNDTLSGGIATEVRTIELEGILADDASTSTVTLTFDNGVDAAFDLVVTEIAAVVDVDPDAGNNLDIIEGAGHDAVGAALVSLVMANIDEINALAGNEADLVSVSYSDDTDLLTFTFEAGINTTDTWAIVSTDAGTFAASAETVVTEGGGAGADTFNFSEDNGYDTIVDFITTEDKLSFDGVVAGLTAVVGTAVATGAVVALALTDDTINVIDDGATALTAAGTQAIVDYADLADVAAYLREGYTSTAADDAAVFVINDLVDGVTYAYSFLEADGVASIIDADELSLLGVITESTGAALVFGDIA